MAHHMVRVRIEATRWFGDDHAGAQPAYKPHEPGLPLHLGRPGRTRPGADWRVFPASPNPGSLASVALQLQAEHTRNAVPVLE